MDADGIDDALHEYREMQPRYAAFASALEVLLTQLLSAEGIEPERVESRPKEVASLSTKLSRPDYSSLDQITDLCGVRIVHYYRDDANRFRAVVKREFDLIEEVHHGDDAADSFGYRSDHFVVKLGAPRSQLSEWQAFAGLVAEIQVRTVLEHAWAAISHKLDYKSSNQVPIAVRRQLFRVAALLETSDELFDDFRKDIEGIRESYASEVARDEWRDLPLDAESLDASWPRFPVSELIEGAVSAGWRAVPVEHSDEAINANLDRLVDVALLSGCKTVGDVREMASEALDQLDVLQEFANIADSKGYRPYALAADILSIKILLDRPRTLATLEVELLDAFTSAVKQMAISSETA